MRDDDQLLQDISAIHPNFEETRQLLSQHGITRYSQLLPIIRDETADVELRVEACWVIGSLREHVDKRRVIPPLLAALGSSDNKIAIAAAHSLGLLDSRRAVPQLMKYAANKLLDEDYRIMPIVSLGMIRDERALPVLRQVMHDQQDRIRVRAEAIERSTEIADASVSDDYLKLLSDPSPDIRFWACYGFVELNHRVIDLTPAIRTLDRIVAFDHTLPLYWGWHVDREAIPVLESFYYRPYNLCERGGECVSSHATQLISPASEYQTFVRSYRQWSDGGLYTTAPQPPVTLNLDPQWLEDKLRARWSDIEFAVCQPQPRAHLLDWLVVIDGQNLLGALHRDGYGVMLTGPYKTILAFAAWYRAIIDPAQPLFLYSWGDPGVPLHPGITVPEIQHLEDKKYSN